MNKTQQVIIGAAILVALGVFITSDFKWLAKKPDAKKDSGMASADGVNPDPYMMLEVNQKDFPNASGSCKSVTIEDLTIKK
jgi:cell division septation protein DedD